MESYKRGQVRAQQIDPRLANELIAAIDQKNITLVDDLVADSDILPTYITFAHTLRKVPSDQLRNRYLNELKTLLMTSNPKFPLLTESERKYIESRKLWTDVVSATDQLNESYKMQSHIKKSLCVRLESLGYENAPSLIEQCIQYLQDHTALVVSFNASMLSDGLNDFQLLNMFEKGISHDDWICDYSTKRTLVETGLFSRLDSITSASLQKNELAKPRYGVLVLLNKDSSILPTGGGYGKSFIVLKNILKYNSLFLAKDSLNYHMNRYGDNPTSKSLTLTTVHHLEILLFECGDRKLKAIIDWVITGSAPSDYSHQNYHFLGVEEYSYIEVLLPAVNLFDPNLIERIHIEEAEYKMPQADLRAVSRLNSEEITTASYYEAYRANRSHLFAATYNNERGDMVKSTILDEYRNELDQITDELRLTQFSEKLDSDPRYKILCTGQGFITRFCNLFCHIVETSSEHALKGMIEDKKMFLAS